MFPVAELESVIKLGLMLLKTRVGSLARYPLMVKTTNMLEGNVVKMSSKMSYKKL